MIADNSGKYIVIKANPNRTYVHNNIRRTTSNRNYNEGLVLYYYESTSSKLLVYLSICNYETKVFIE